MASHDNFGIALEDLALEPSPERVSEEVNKGRAKFQIDTRSGGARVKCRNAAPIFASGRTTE